MKDIRNKNNKMVQNHNKMVKAVLKVMDDMEKTGVKSWSAEFYNDFKVSIIDLKSSKFRAKERLKGSVKP